MMMFYRERTFKNNPNKGFCVQWEIKKPNPIFFFYNMFDISKEGIRLYISWFGLIHVNIGWSRETDHAGPEFTLDIFGFLFHNVIYDTRHWNYDRAEWDIYPKQEKKQ
jgi:hypothetical protein